MSQLDTLYTSMMGAIYGDTSEAVNYVAADGLLSAQAQLAIYQGSVKGGLVQALGDLYPATKGLVGERFFNAMALRYVGRYPSRSSSLDHYGEFFSSFIAGFTPLAELPYLVDLAALEWCWHRAFHANTTNVVSADLLAEIPAAKVESLRFELADPLFLCRSDYPLLELWNLGKAPDESAQTLDIEQGGGSYVLYREGLDVRIEKIAEPLFDLLQELKKTQTFGTICETWLSKHPASMLDFYTAELMQRSWIAGFHFDNA